MFQAQTSKGGKPSTGGGEWREGETCNLGAVSRDILSHIVRINFEFLPGTLLPLTGHIFRTPLAAVAPQ